MYAAAPSAKSISTLHARSSGPPFCFRAIILLHLRARSQSTDSFEIMWKNDRVAEMSIKVLGRETGLLGGDARMPYTQPFFRMCVTSATQVFMDPNFDQYLPGDDFMTDYLGSLTNTAVLDVSRHRLSGDTFHILVAHCSFDAQCPSRLPGSIVTSGLLPRRDNNSSRSRSSNRDCNVRRACRCISKCCWISSKRSSKWPRSSSSSSSS